MTTALMTQTHLNHLSISDLLQLGTILVGTGFLPTSIKTPEQAVAVMLKGQELAIPPMYALSNIAVINGKPTVGAELMLSLIYRDHGDDAITFTAATDAIATVSYKRRGWSTRQSFSFSMDDAKTAGLATGATWTKYPAALLRARCVSAVARMAFPDSIGGMYTPEEMGSTADAETGEITVTVDPTTGEKLGNPPPNRPIPHLPPPPLITRPAGTPPNAHDGAGAPAGSNTPVSAPAATEQAPAAPRGPLTPRPDIAAVVDLIRAAPTETRINAIVRSLAKWTWEPELQESINREIADRRSALAQEVQA